MTWTRDGWAIEALRRASAKVARSQPGGRNDELFRESVGLVAYVRDGTLGEDRMMADLAEAAEAAGLGGREAHKAISSALANAAHEAAWYPTASSAGPPQRPPRASTGRWGTALAAAGGTVARGAPAVARGAVSASAVAAAVELRAVELPSDHSFRLSYFGSNREKRGWTSDSDWRRIAESVLAVQHQPAAVADVDEAVIDVIKDRLPLWAGCKWLGDDARHRGGERAPVESFSSLFLDYDEEPSFSEEAVAGWWGAFSWIAHSSAKHMVEKNGTILPRGRVVIPLGREVTPDEYELIAQFLISADRFGRYGRKELKNIRQQYYAPSRITEDFWAAAAPGPLLALDVDHLLAQLTAPSEAVLSVAETPAPPVPVPSLLLTCRDRADAAHYVGELLGDSGMVWRYGGQLCYLSGGALHPYGARDVAPFALALGEVVSCFAPGKPGPDGEVTEPRAIAPPAWLTSSILRASPLYVSSAPRIDSVMNTPYLREDGSIGQTAGHDEAARVLYLPDREFAAVPDVPTAAQVEDAVEELFWLVREFPFAGPAHRAAWLALLLTPFARPSFSGPAPGFVISANAPGAGKGKLAQLALIPSLGRVPRALVFSSTEDEREKTLRTLVQRGATVGLFDNVTGSLGGASLDQMLTATSFEARILGVTASMLVDQLRLTLVFTANNATFFGDTARRVLPITLEVDHSRPEDRVFEVSDVISVARHRRAEQVAAALTILRHGALTAAPALPPWGSYEAWSAVVRTAVVAAGLVDPYEARGSVRADDLELEEHERLVLMLAAIFGSAEWSIGDLADLLDGAHIRTQVGAGWTVGQCRSVLSDLGVWDRRGESLNRIRMGKRLRKYAKRRTDAGRWVEGAVTASGGAKRRRGRGSRLWQIWGTDV